MITHIFNSSIVSGPETLVIPALNHLEKEVTLVFLVETRLWEQSQKPIEYAKSLNHKVYTVPVRSRWDAKAFLELRNVLDEIRPRIVHAHDVKASVYLYRAKLARPNFKGAIVSTHHGASYRKGKIKIYEEFYVRFVLPHFDQVLCVCENDRRSIVKRGVPEEKVHIHLNGTDRLKVDSEEKKRISYEIRARWKMLVPNLPDPDQAIFLGAVARLSPEKRHDRMLHVLQFLHASHRTLRPVLLFFGSGPEEARLKTLAWQLGVEGHVFWMGYSPTISNEMAGFDLVLSLSDGEGIPISLLEAGWAGTPVVATSVGGIPDLISSHEYGVLVKRENQNAEIAHSVQDVLLNRNKMKEIGSAFQSRVMTNFSEKAWLNRLNEIYQNIL